MLYFRLIVLDLLAQISHAGLMLTAVNPIFEFEEAS